MFERFKSFAGKVSGASDPGEDTGSTAKMRTGESRGYVPPRNPVSQTSAQIPVQQEAPQEQQAQAQPQPQFSQFAQTGMQTGRQPVQQPAPQTAKKAHLWDRFHRAVPAQPVQESQQLQAVPVAAQPARRAAAPSAAPSQTGMQQKPYDFAAPSGMMQSVMQPVQAPAGSFTSKMPYHQPAQLQETGYQPKFDRRAQQQAYRPRFNTSTQQPQAPAFSQSVQQPQAQAFAQSAQQPQAQAFARSAQQPAAFAQGRQATPQERFFQPAQPQQPQAQQKQSFVDRMAAQPQPSVQPAPQQPQRPQWGNGQGERGFNYSARMERLQSRPSRAERAQQRQQQMPPMPTGNVRYMDPRNFVGQDGTAYAMAIRLTQPLSTSRCYRIIEFMRNGEAVLVNMELMQDAIECDRCLDLLYGAAYAMGYTFTRVASHVLYLIAPRTVNVQAYASINDIAQRDNASRWPGSDPSNPLDGSWLRAPAQGQQPQTSPEQTGYGQAPFGQTGYGQAAFSQTGYGQSARQEPMGRGAGARQAPVNYY